MSALATVLLTAGPCRRPPRRARRPGHALDVAAVVDRVQKRYDAAADFRAHFSQTLTNPTFKRKTSSAGEVLLKKPGRMRWNYQTPDPKMYLADGAIALAVRTGGQAGIQAGAEVVAATRGPGVPDRKGQAGRRVRHRSSPAAPGVGTPRDYVLSLHPRQAQPQVKEITFVVDPDSFLVRESVLVDGQGNINDMVFTDIKISTGLPDSTFRWSPPAGIRVIDAAKLGK